MPLSDFQREFAVLNPERLSGAPIHCTVVISLVGATDEVSGRYSFEGHLWRQYPRSKQENLR